MTSPYRNISTLDFLVAQANVLEDLFGKAWFETILPKHVQHPAYQKWKFCQNIIHNKGHISSPPQAIDLMKVVLDNALLVECSGGNPADITLQSFLGYGDAKVQTRLKSEILHPKNFLAILTELAYASSHIGRHRIVPSQADGFADFVVSLGAEHCPLIVDCKRVGADTKDTRIATVIKKANKQIKKYQQQCYGLVVIDISSQVPLVLIPRDKPSEDRFVPPQVEMMRTLCRDALKTVNTSVSGALLVWDECEMLGDPLRVDRSLCFFTRRSIVVPHAKPLVSLPEPSSLYEVAFTLAIWVTWNKSPIS